MLFLVEGTVYRTPYMGDEESFPHRTLVEADSAEEAEHKYEQWWRDKTDEYSVYYHAHGTAMEPIL